MSLGGPAVQATDEILQRRACARRGPDTGWLHRSWTRSWRACTTRRALRPHPPCQGAREGAAGSPQEGHPHSACCAAAPAAHGRALAHAGVCAQTMDAQEGVLYYLLDQMAEQHIKETLLAYVILLTSGAPPARHLLRLG